MARLLTESSGSTGSQASSEVLSKVIANVSTGQLACFHDGLGISAWNHPPALQFGQGLRLPYASLETSKTQRGSAVVPESVAMPSESQASCVLANGNVVVVYSGASTNLRFAIYTPAGALVKAVTQVAAVSNVKAEAAALADGGFVIAYISSGYVYHVRYDAIGSPQSNGNTGSSSSVCSVTGLTNGGYVIAFVDSSAAKFIRYDATGTQQGSVTTSDASSVTSSNIGVAGLTGGGFVLTWATSSPAVKFARYDNSGVLQGAVTTVAAHSASWPQVAALTTGGFAVVYLDGTPNFPRYAVYSATGTVVKAVTQLTDVTGNSKLCIVGLINGGFAIAYKQNSAVYFLDPSGNLDPATMSFSALSGGSGLLCDLSALVDGGLLVFATNASSYPTIGFFSSAAVTIVGVFTTSALAGGTATIETFGVTELSGAYAESKSFSHTGGTLPGNKGTVFNGSIYLKGLS